MKEDTIIQQVVSEINSAVAADVDVRTAGGDQDTDIPEVIINWDSSRINGNGHNSFGGYVTDNSGNKTGVEHHTYWMMEIDCTAKHHSEVDRDKIIDTIQSAFIPYEFEASRFHKDTREWDVGSVEGRENPVLEPDWYEAGILITFEYMKRVDTTEKDTIEDIDTTITVEQDLEETSTSIN